LQDKKMVDGKGGNLKTIHHYKTERLSCTAALQIFLLTIMLPPPVVQILSALPAGSIREKKGSALVSSLLLRLFAAIRRTRFRSLDSVRRHEKIILLNPVGIEVCPASLAALRISFPLFPFHIIQKAIAMPIPSILLHFTIPQ
jgi:hypothetical protein